jgi:hypothetical protein
MKTQLYKIIQILGPTSKAKHVILHTCLLLQIANLKNAAVEKKSVHFCYRLSGSKLLVILFYFS